jgi:hypothetical protein
MARAVTRTKRIDVIAPPGRHAHARDLRPIFEIGTQRLEQSLLPPTITAPDGKVLVTRPNEYRP